MGETGAERNMEMKELLVIVPTRERPKKIDELIEAYMDTTSGNSELLICLDDDDSGNYTFSNVGFVSVMIRPRMRLGPWLNYVVNEYETDCQFVGFMGDDHRPRTPDWDLAVVEPLRNSLGVSYGNDLLQGENLPTAVFMNKEITDKLGYFCPPEQIHLYLDDYWKALGKRLGSFHYLPDVIIEHEHFTSGKSEIDALYSEVNSATMFNHDFVAFDKYMREQFMHDTVVLF